MLSNIQISRPIAFIDLETTGVHPEVDRIVEISILKILPDGTTEARSHLINPGIPIPPEASAVHKIMDDDIKDKPTFQQYANDVCQFLDDCDLSGFNLITFDLPLLEAEFIRAGFTFIRDNRYIVDSMTIYHHLEAPEYGKPRNLQAAYQKYYGEELENAHGARIDVTASAKILDAMVNTHDELPNDIEGLCKFCDDIRKDYIDIEGKFIYQNGKAVFSFGKHMGLSLEQVATESPSYLEWISRSDFRPDVLEIVRNALIGVYPSK